MTRPANAPSAGAYLQRQSVIEGIVPRIGRRSQDEK